MSVLDKPQLAIFGIGKGILRTRRFFSSASKSLIGLSSFVPKRLIKAPSTLQTTDTEIAQEFYSGRYLLGGKLVQTNGKSPFLIGSQSDAWDRSLHSFEWLRHLSASEDQRTGNHARGLINDWIELHIQSSEHIAWDIEVTSRRLIAWLCNSILIVSNCDDKFHELFMRILANHVRFLKKEVSSAPVGMPRFYASIALSYASLCFETVGKPFTMVDEQLAQELNTQILPDGGHSTRNPACIVDILMLLLPLKQLYSELDKQPPEQLLNAIDRLYQAFHFFRLADGQLARFNGAGHINADSLTTLTRLDETRAKPVAEAKDSGYQRLMQGETILLMDVGPAPKGELSTKAHAGCLSFEMSHGEEVIITNCGVPKYQNNEDAAIWRASGAHSAAVLNETSSCKFEHSGTGGKYVGGQIYSANLKPECAREDGSDYCAISAVHHGYVRDYGIRHQRNLILDQDGQRLSGNDWFSRPDKGDLRPSTKDDACLHFHLPPSIKASLAKDNHTCLIETRDGQKWAFSAEGFKLDLEESIYFAGIARPIPNWQIVIRARVAKTPEIKWVLQKLSAD